MTKVINWKKIHRFQKKAGWCGPAVIQMVLLVAGIKKKQKDIVKAVYKKWWGTDQQLMMAYLSGFFKIVNFKNNATFSDIEFHLNKGNIVVVDWMDDFDDGEPGGHYSIVGDYDKKAKMLTLIDPSNARDGIWNISTRDFNPRWYDTLDLHNRTWVDGWMLWVDPKSKIEK
jgi:hypothetical protein